MIKPVNDLDQLWASFFEGPLQYVTTEAGLPDYNVKRLELVDAWASGNKYYKLKYVIQNVLHAGVKTIVSKGGMFSNHLAALAEACEVFDIQLIAIVRSHQADEKNPSINYLRSKGVEVVYKLSSAYKLFDAAQAEAIYPQALFVPEGGLTTLGIKGSSEIVKEIVCVHPTHVVIAGGTMSTACGLLSALPASVKLIVVPAWKGCTNEYFEQIIDEFDITYSCSWELWPNYHFGGFGKFNQELINFMLSYKKEVSITLDPIYTSKLLYAVHDQLRIGYFDPSSSIVVIHSGGLQGLAGFKYRFPESGKLL